MFQKKKVVKITPLNHPLVLPSLRELSSILTGAQRASAGLGREMEAANPPRAVGKSSTWWRMFDIVLYCLILSAGLHAGD